MSTVGEQDFTETTVYIFVLSLENVFCNTQDLVDFANLAVNFQYDHHVIYVVSHIRKVF